MKLRLYSVFYTTSQQPLVTSMQVMAKSKDDAYSKCRKSIFEDWRKSHPGEAIMSAPIQNIIQVVVGECHELSKVIIASWDLIDTQNNNKRIKVKIIASSYQTAFDEFNDMYIEPNPGRYLDANNLTAYGRVNHRLVAKLAQEVECGVPIK